MLGKDFGYHVKLMQVLAMSQYLNVQGVCHEDTRWRLSSDLPSKNIFLLANQGSEGYFACLDNIFIYLRFNGSL